jgi:hypothetical protein
MSIINQSIPDCKSFINNLQHIFAIINSVFPRRYKITIQYKNDEISIGNRKMSGSYTTQYFPITKEFRSCGYTSDQLDNLIDIQNELTKYIHIIYDQLIIIKNLMTPIIGKYKKSRTKNRQGFLIDIHTETNGELTYIGINMICSDRVPTFKIEL